MLSLSHILIIPITVSASYHCRTLQLILRNMRNFSPNVLPQQYSTVQRHVMWRPLEYWDASNRILEKVCEDNQRSTRGTLLWTVSVMKSWVDSEHQQTLKQQNIFRRHRNQPGSFLCGLGKVIHGHKYSLERTTVCSWHYRESPEIPIAVSQSWKWSSIQTFTACTIQIYRPKPQKSTSSQSHGEIFTFEKLVLENVLHFCLENDSND